ncbi:hypothetical protein B0H15DRAFT_794832 [Mycena belliarum]|uniref:Uncharacterized protein n=1 Tax=Mycena belliarum TaxID=1033014 RepID=A0AAD6XFC8_9AGAR|nr:hypothetical protein B0H15DRAFT_794832 [Mycena belliae]
MNAFNTGQLIPTFRYPAGILVALRILPLIADLGAIRKVAGYLAHNATQFCSFCLQTLDQIDDLNYQSWTLRDAATVRAQGQKWRDLPTVKAKEERATETGVRWSPMHNLVNWDPVKHVVLGFMHNTLEGMAEHHLRMLWGIGRQNHAAKDLIEQQKEELFTESDASEASQDIQELQNEADHPEQLAAYMAFRAASSTTPTPQNPQNPGDLFMGNFDDDEGDPDFFPPDFDHDGTGAFNFTDDQLELVRDCIKNVHLPTWVGRPPTNLGEAAHGKLKAHELLILFTVIFPLIIPELWWRKGQISQ